jgi:predicted nucleic acid-binding protein
VLAAALLGERATGAEAAAVLVGRWDLAAPSHWKAELSNVVWKAVRLEQLDAANVDRVLTLAEAFPIRSVDVFELWRGAVGRAIAAEHPAYDTLFIELAIRLGTHVVSYDRQLRLRFPGHVRTPRRVLAEAR